MLTFPSKCLLAALTCLLIIVEYNTFYFLNTLLSLYEINQFLLLSIMQSYLPFLHIIFPEIIFDILPNYKTSLYGRPHNWGDKTHFILN